MYVSTSPDETVAIFKRIATERKRAEEVAEAEAEFAASIADWLAVSMNPLQLANFVSYLMATAKHPIAGKIERVLEKWAEAYELGF